MYVVVCLVFAKRMFILYLRSYFYCICFRTFCICSVLFLFVFFAWFVMPAQNRKGRVFEVVLFVQLYCIFVPFVLSYFRIFVFLYFCIFVFLYFCIFVRSVSSLFVVMKKWL